jgi:AraC family transcriptional regulator, regulatory protein of adaptative response / methylated-DNA-[protein]-cysteine methyltransferase
MHSLPPVTEMERAFLESDRTYDGLFFTAVRTTGIFCRPSCRARKPFPEHVEYFRSAREALFAGYRPCKRCEPLTMGGAPSWVADLLSAVEREPDVRLSDAVLRARGIDPARARRYFLKEYGMTFQAYSRARRLSGAFQALKRGDDLDEVTLGSGYESHSGFREAFGRLFGQPPGESRDADCIVTTWLESPLGPLVAAASPRGICLLEFSDRRRLEGQVETMRRRFGCAVVPGQHPHLHRLSGELARYFAGELQQFTLPLDYPGTPFQESVWKALLEIPYGETQSYEAIARKVGVGGASRAVGRANGMNRIAIVIPCHRVVNKDGKLGGYGGGLWRKQFLLDLERRGALPFDVTAERRG